MKEGQATTLICLADTLCITRPNLHWEWINAEGRSSVVRGYYDKMHGYGPYERNRLHLTPTADDHNTNITCVADYGYNVVKTTVTLTLKYNII